MQQEINKTIGILASSNHVAADLFGEITRQAELAGAISDQDHPNIVVYSRRFDEQLISNTDELKAIESDKFKIYEGTKILKTMGCDCVFSLDGYKENLFNSQEPVMSALDLYPHGRKESHKEFLRPRHYAKFLKNQDVENNKECLEYQKTLSKYAQYIFDLSHGKEISNHRIHIATEPYVDLLIDPQIHDPNKDKEIITDLPSKFELLFGNMQAAHNVPKLHAHESLSDFFDKIIDDKLYLPYGTAGIFGGVGPAAGGDALLLAAIESSHRRDKENGRKMGYGVILSSIAKIVNRTDYIAYQLWQEYDAAQDRGDLNHDKPIIDRPEGQPPNPVPEMADIVVRFYKIDVNKYILACNTAHWLIPEINQELANRGHESLSKFVNIIEEAVRAAPPPSQAEFAGKTIVLPVAIIGTTITNCTKLYEKAAEKMGRKDLKFFYPDHEKESDVIQKDKTMQEVAHEDLIYDGVKAGNMKKARQAFRVLIKHLEQKAMRYLPEMPQDEKYSILKRCLVTFEACTEVPVTERQCRSKNGEQLLQFVHPIKNALDIIFDDLHKNYEKLKQQHLIQNNEVQKPSPAATKDKFVDRLGNVISKTIVRKDRSQQFVDHRGVPITQMDKGRLEDRLVDKYGRPLIDKIIENKENASDRKFVDLTNQPISREIEKDPKTFKEKLMHFINISKPFTRG